MAGTNKPHRRAIAIASAMLATVGQPAAARADTSGDAADGVVLRAVRTRLTGYVQDGTGYQSRAGTAKGPGSARLVVFEPQLALTIDQSKHLTHELWVPIDVVTSASADAVDVMTSSSRQNSAATVAWTGTYHDGDVTAGARAAVHAEENFRSWTTGVFGSHAFAEQNTVFSGSANVSMDHLNVYQLEGATLGGRLRSTINLNVGATQLLSPTTVLHADVGYSSQRGEMGNTWNTVPIATTPISRDQEVLPITRRRLAAVARVVQGLPLGQSLRVGYRAYLDDWEASSHTLELDFFQRVASWAFVRLTYRRHEQSGVSFFTTLAPNYFGFRTADSDLGSFTAQTLGGRLDLTLFRNDRARRGASRDIHLDFGYEKYFRSNDLTVDVTTCGLTFLF